MKSLLTGTVCLTYLCTYLAQIHGDCKFSKMTVQKESLKAYQKIKPLLGKRFTVEDPEGNYKYHVGICTDAMAGHGDSEENGVVQEDLSTVTADGKHKMTAVGKYSSASIMAGTNWLYLQYSGGENYGHHCASEERKAVILFTCDPSATDSTPGMRVLEEENTKESECYYLFELAHPEICEVTPPSSSSLSIGSIILIVLFSVMAVYLIAGALYQRFVLGAKGIEQIPNYEFWKDFGNLQADGCDFVCRSHDARRSTPYKGLGDDQLEEPEERDDNLLPM